MRKSLLFYFVGSTDRIVLCKFLVNGAHCRFKTGLGDTDDDVLLGGALIDHANVDIRFCDCLEDTACRTLCLDHTASDNGDERKVFVIGDGIRLNGLADLIDNHVLNTFQIALVENDAHGIDTGGQMLKYSENLKALLCELEDDCEQFTYLGSYTED